MDNLLFAKIHDRFQRLEVGYFHNTVYGTVYRDSRRTEPLSVAELLRRPAETRLLVLGDACMAPSELMAPRGAIAYDADDVEPSIVWLQKLRARFRHSVWLNPIPREHWPQTYGHQTLARIGTVFPMHDLTLRGIRAAVEQLSGQR